ncbi:aspartate kinase [Clostridium sp. PL3]|uniref:Aspartokinase n=1 Tax=Clostridium thailandense TaxID=2794346 RepID=A0A949U074_9CLOT|nr:aspartate kinase [Clostridium thailandense]MBV7274915.1 aspartate kinase [Clostridium thailandense]
MKILVQKFGGTSVSTADRREMVVQKILKAKGEGFSTIVVVSAMGRKGQPYATDTLLSLISDEYKRENTLGVDLLMSCGEIISTVVMSEELCKNGLKAVPLTGGQAGIITDDNYNNASVLRVDSEKLLNIVKQGKIPVVAGFQGISENGFITTLGRGGSDVTASLLGAALKSEEIHIYTDVDGIMTADPRIVSDASLIKKISYNEVFQFADQGAKVIHPRAVEIAMKSNVKLVIKNTLNDCEGTIITSGAIRNTENIITGITSMDKRVQVTVELDKNKCNENYNTILDELAKNLISIDLINVFPKQKIFTIDGKDINIFKDIMDKLELNYYCVEECSKIAVIGSRMRGLPGVMAKILRTLTKANVEVLQTADSHTTIWCLVESKNSEKAINALHNEFKLGC